MSFIYSTGEKLKSSVPPYQPFTNQKGYDPLGEMLDHKSSFTSIIYARASLSTEPSNVVLTPGFAVLVLGASQGIGASIARSYAIAQASTLMLVARDAFSAEITVASCQQVRGSSVKPAMSPLQA